MSKTAILGGTFDPVHFGHIKLAESAVRECNLDKLYFMPNYISPFKTENIITPAVHRSRMIKLVTDKSKTLDILEYEILKKGESYTYETLVEFKEKLSSDIYFIIGLDSAITLENWYKGDKLLREFKFIVSKRIGCDTEKAKKTLDRYQSEYNADFTFLEMEPLDISSTTIREAVIQGSDLGNYVPKTVEDYIIKNGLYL